MRDVRARQAQATTASRSLPAVDGRGSRSCRRGREGESKGTQRRAKVGRWVESGGREDDERKRCLLREWNERAP